MNNMNRVLMFVFVLLFGVIVFEGYFYFFSLNSKNNLVKQTPSVNFIPKDQAIDPSTLANLSRLDKDVLTSSVVTNTFNGQIVEIDNQPGITPTGLMHYSLKIGLKGPKGTTQYFFFNSTDMKFIKIVQKVKNDEKPLETIALKVGDNISIIIILDLLKNLGESSVAIKIVKI